MNLSHSDSLGSIRKILRIFIFEDAPLTPRHYRQRLMMVLVSAQSLLSGCSDHKRFQWFPILVVLSEFGLVLVSLQNLWCPTQNYPKLNKNGLLLTVNHLLQNRNLFIVMYTKSNSYFDQQNIYQI